MIFLGSKSSHQEQHVIGTVKTDVFKNKFRSIEKWAHSDMKCPWISVIICWQFTHWLTVYLKCLLLTNTCIALDAWHIVLRVFANDQNNDGRLFLWTDTKRSKSWQRFILSWRSHSNFLSTTLETILFQEIVFREFASSKTRLHICS